MQKIGVFVCWCGSNIAGTVDVHAVAEAMKNLSLIHISTNESLKYNIHIGMSACQIAIFPNWRFPTMINGGNKHTQ